MRKKIVSLITFIFLSTLSYSQDFVSSQNYDICSEEIQFNSQPTDVVHFSPPQSLLMLFAQDELITHDNQGYNGCDVSAVTGPGTLYGFGWQQQINNRMADDFIVQNGATIRIDSIKFYAYQTNSSTTSSITSCNLKIWNGVPENGSSQTIWGDYTTNRMIRTYFSGIYRTHANPPYNNQTNRPIMCVTVNVNLTLTQGTYWLDGQCSGSISNGPWAPPRTILNQPNTGNARQKTSTGWINAEDGGYPKGLPFIIYGTTLTPIINNHTIAKNFSLEQNYPNPFNPTSKIKYQISKAGSVRLTVFDANGSEVAVLVDKKENAGIYEVTFNGKDLSSGVYYYRLDGDNFTETKKMILLK